MNEEMNNIVELIDENDETVKFEHIMTIQYANNDYVILAPLEQLDGVNEDEVVILRIEQDSEGEDIYVGIEDEDELEEVYEAFLQIAEQDDGNDENDYD